MIVFTITITITTTYGLKRPPATTTTITTTYFLFFLFGSPGCFLSPSSNAMSAFWPPRNREAFFDSEPQAFFAPAVFRREQVEFVLTQAFDGVCRA